MGTQIYDGMTPFHLWVPTNMDDSELSELLDMCGEVHMALVHIQQNNIHIWEGLELLENIVPNMDDYLDYIESQV